MSDGPYSHVYRITHLQLSRHSDYWDEKWDSVWSTCKKFK